MPPAKTLAAVCVTLKAQISAQSANLTTSSSPTRHVLTKTAPLDSHGTVLRTLAKMLHAKSITVETVSSRALTAVMLAS